MKKKDVKEWPKKVCSIIYRAGDDILDQCFPTGFQKLYCTAEMFMLKSRRLNLNKLVFLKILGPLRVFNI